MYERDGTAGLPAATSTVREPSPIITLVERTISKSPSAVTLWEPAPPVTDHGPASAGVKSNDSGPGPLALKEERPAHGAMLIPDVEAPTKLPSAEKPPTENVPRISPGGGGTTIWMSSVIGSGPTKRKSTRCTSIWDGQVGIWLWAMVVVEASCGAVNGAACTQ